MRKNGFFNFPPPQFDFFTNSILFIDDILPKFIHWNCNLKESIDDRFFKYYIILYKPMEEFEILIQFIYIVLNHLLFKRLVIGEVNKKKHRNGGHEATDP